MTIFKVCTDEDGSYENFAGDDNTFKFDEHGLLNTFRAETRERRVWSPVAWRYVEDIRPESKTSRVIAL